MRKLLGEFLLWLMDAELDCKIRLSDSPLIVAMNNRIIALEQYINNERMRAEHASITALQSEAKKIHNAQGKSVKPKSPAPKRR